MTDTLYRAALEIQANEGRTISGLAVPWDRPTKVRDQTGPPYLEAFAPGSGDVSIRQHPNFPIFARHDYMVDPVGVVAFHRSAEGALFEGTLSKTRDADDKLELINDGAMRSVSIGFRPLQAVRRRFTEGETVYRTEVAIRELSLAPTGFGQYAEAGVLAVRAEMPDALAAALGEALVRDTGADWAVYEHEAGLLRVSFTTAEDGTVTLSEPEPVAVSYEPTTRTVIENNAGHDDLKRRAAKAARAVRIASLTI